SFTDTGNDADGGTNDEYFGCDDDDTAHMGDGNDLGVGDGLCGGLKVPVSGDVSQGDLSPNECLLGGQNFDSPQGGPGPQNPGDDDIFGEGGNDSLWGCEQDDLVEGGPGDDTLDLGDDTDQGRGGPGEDSIEG